MKSVMIVAGESSGEWYGSRLAAELKSLWPDVKIVGIGGEKMREAGVEIISGISGAFGLTELIPSMRRIRESFRRAKEALGRLRPDAVVLIDFPDFNFRLGKVAKDHGLKVIYYVSPQIWAWRKGRVTTMGEIADRVSVILPFEEKIYGAAGIPCEFVGHPAMEEIEEIGGSVHACEGVKETLREGLGLTGTHPVLSLLPGSRPNELKALLPVFVPLVRKVRSEYPDAGFILPLAPNAESERFKGYFNVLKAEGVIIVRGDAVRCLASSDAAVVASGTATLQAAFLGVPMVVVYRLSSLTYMLGRMIIDTSHISLVNIIAGKTVVRELLQGDANAEEIMNELRRILNDASYREGMVSSLKGLREAFSGRRPSRRVAESIGEMAGWTLLTGREGLWKE